MAPSFRFAALAAALLLAAQAPVPARPPSPAPSEIVEAAPASAWVAIAPADLLVMDLAPDAAGRPRRVVIQLMPPPFSRGWIGNIRKLAAAHWWDGTSVNRVQDNYVVQWGDADAEDRTKARPLPPRLATMTSRDYLSRIHRDRFDRPTKTDASDDPGLLASTFKPKFVRDAYASVGFVRGWPIAADGQLRWPVHCYGMVGVGRGMSPDTGSGAELYTVIGHAPRHLDRNIALVGRVIAGIEHLSSLPRGTEALGFYKTPQERTPILRIRLAADLPVSEQPRFEYLSTESAAFARYAEARANRRDPFFIRPAGGADICNVPVPVRAMREGGTR